jgi:hypothetical protein
MIDMNAAALRVSEKMVTPFIAKDSSPVESYRTKVLNADNKNPEQLKIIFLIDILAEMLSPAAAESKHDKIADYLAHVEYNAVLDWDEGDGAWISQLHAFYAGVIAVSDYPNVAVRTITQLLLSEAEARVAKMMNPKCEVEPLKR